ncbi:MAG: phosphate ABC transporter substrate-binding protein PstS [Herbiconiux sp.]|uniref:phosphate ABC transporter substrate-binding protein PstS n=1 Tax=Herbiconiux sp. TaxID=1871186 RepID=UPI001229C002|nr:phosphate ABC transporter substrate-binding protein PstS [Herbiconiux sp.]TAJ47569.1 MAG: phosphate ABC transporter substrate-binding protein PstS [Herbiconiux sp.]
MKLKNVAAVGTLALATALALSACSGSSTGGTTTDAATPSAAAPSIDFASLSGTITAGGSSAQANAEAAWITAFTAQAKGVTINYDKSQGSGGGVTNWLAGSYDFAGSDSPLKDDQQASSQAICGAGGALNLPVYLDGVAVIYNLPGVTDLNLSSATIAKIFSLQITTWNDPAIAAENPDATLPATAITTVTRSDGSGTTTNFTNYLSQTQPTIWTNAPGNAWPIAGSSAQQGGSGVVNTVKAGEGTIGYADHSAIGDLTSANIQVGTGSDYVPFSAEGASNAFTAAATTKDTGVKGDLAQSVDYTKITEADAYPIPLISYQILCTTFADEAQGELTKAFVSYVASDQGQQIAAKNAGSAPIPADMLAEIQTSLELVK